MKFHLPYLDAFLRGALFGLFLCILLIILIVAVPDAPSRVSDDEWQRIVYRCSDPQLDPESQDWCHKFLSNGGKYE